MVIYCNFYVDLIKYVYISAAALYLGNLNFGLQSKPSILSTVDLMKLLCHTATCVFKLIYYVKINILGL